jgi:NTP pyrophosphatase (non-canonical NTP hydrolase)
MSADPPPSSISDLDTLRQRLREFASARDWDQFHAPKNLAMALIVEAAELVEHFQWLTAEESANPPAERKAAIAAEMADVLVYLVRLADKLEIDLMSAVSAKMAHNEAKYPAQLVKGSARKYNEY